MFHKLHVKQRPGESVCEVFFMNGVLNCAIFHTASESNNNHEIRVMRCFERGDLDDSVDYKICSLIAFIPNADVFYCSSERQRADASFEKRLFLWTGVGFVYIAVMLVFVLNRLLVSQCTLPFVISIPLYHPILPNRVISESYDSDTMHCLALKPLCKCSTIPPYTTN